MNPCISLLLSTAPYCREARVTFAWRRTACGMRHCFARRIDGCLGRRKLGCTTTRQAERHPQGVCRIRKAAEPPTAAQQRIVGAEANRIAASNAATPRYGQCNRQALQLFELLACNVKTFLLGDLKGDILFCEREYPPLPAPLRVRRDSRFVLTNNFSHGMLTTIKGSEKEAFSFHPLKRGDGRCKSLRNGKGGAFEPRGGNAAPVPPLQGNEVPRIQRGIQVEPRTMICSP